MVRSKSGTAFAHPIYDRGPQRAGEDHLGEGMGVDGAGSLHHVTNGGGQEALHGEKLQRFVDDSVFEVHQEKG